ncbi:MAG TPA: hypothetical protein VKV03_10260 [Candidatus Binataceae bacterium]|nr:hypothetical protein [Candidatus Binataceae bacterium]
MSEIEKSLDGASAPWLEILDGNAPILLIAPHGGRAGQATRALLNPKVNDLHTAAITRELSALLDAPALINGAMDRNHLDLNRLSQVSANAPWFLEMILERLTGIIVRHGHATILVIHGWNVIQARVDLGLGLRRHGDQLRPPGAARVSASDDFIRGALGQLAAQLDTQGILASFGLRYPGGGAQNLLQAFTDRHIESAVPVLRELSAMAARNQIDAVQLELSVALRMPGELRRRCIASIGAIFGGNSHRKIANGTRSDLTVVRSPAPKRPATATPGAATAMPTRVGVELFDPSAKIGAMASFDLGAGGVGARIMMLLSRGRVALFTGEGKPRRDGNRLSLGPLALESDRDGLLVSFRGHAVIVPDATHYLSIERALASGWLDESMEVSILLEPSAGNASFDLEQLFEASDDRNRESSIATFGRLSGSVRIDGATSAIKGVGRSGLSFTGLGPQRFNSRRMIWACFDDAVAPTAIEMRAVSSDAQEQSSGRILNGSEWTACTVNHVAVDTPSVSSPPTRVSAGFGDDDSRLSLIESVENFIPLSRPGPDGTRIFTALGFARFRLGESEGAGMFECSRRAETLPDSTGDDDAED